METELYLDPNSNPDPESDPKLSTDPDPILKIISDPAGSVYTTLPKKPSNDNFSKNRKTDEMKNISCDKTLQTHENSRDDALRHTDRGGGCVRASLREWIHIRIGRIGFFFQW